MDDENPNGDGTCQECACGCDYDVDGGACPCMDAGGCSECGCNLVDAEN